MNSSKDPCAAQSFTAMLIGRTLGIYGCPLSTNWIGLRSIPLELVVTWCCSLICNCFSCDFGLSEGMAEDGWLPTCFAHRSRFDTPSLPLAVITVLVLVRSSATAPHRGKHSEQGAVQVEFAFFWHRGWTVTTNMSRDII